MKYYKGRLARSAFGGLRDDDACSICGAKHYSNRLTEDGKKVCEDCFDKDTEKEIIEYEKG